ncbi:MAG: PD-(D/E)XK nuclease family protein, partial [Acidobacteriaceae bacterium]|nr:PD-(D/E)XK nuclease family protein [Acidobacteriaceae bacterium]
FRIPRVLGGNSGQELELSGDEIAHLTPIADALRILRELHRQRNYRPVADTIARLLETTRAHIGFILRPAGEQVLANVLHVAELARQYEASGGISFRGFIDELKMAAESEGAEAPILEESSDGVRLMTVHKAKGLEFPVVILADLTCRLSRDDASRYTDVSRGFCALKLSGWAPHELHLHEAEEVARDRAEGVRIAYVAATRARDLLVVPAVGDEPWEGGWLSPLSRALYPELASRRSAARAEGCPSFTSKDSVLERPNDEPASIRTVCPGAHLFAAGYAVVWWDPTSAGGLTLDATAPLGVRRHDLIVKDVPRDVVADGRANYDRWKLSRHEAVASGSVPSLGVSTAREWAAESAADEEQDAVAELPSVPLAIVDLSSGDAVMHVGGAAYGLLVHAVLAKVPFDADDCVLTAAADAEARMLGLTDDAVRMSVEAAKRLLGHDLGRRAGAAQARRRCRRETAVTCTMRDGHLVEGIVDLAFEEQGVWHVVDFKTDREIDEASEERYRRQVALYASAIARATGMPVTGTIVKL